MVKETSVDISPHVSGAPEGQGLLISIKREDGHLADSCSASMPSLGPSSCLSGLPGPLRPSPGGWCQAGLATQRSHGPQETAPAGLIPGGSAQPPPAGKVRGQTPRQSHQSLNGPGGR